MVNLTRSPFGLATRSPNAMAPAACVDPDKLAEALELMKMAKLSSQGRNRRRSLAGKYGEARELMRPIAELCLADVDLHRAPHEAVQDFLENRAKASEPDEPWRRRRGRKRRVSGFASEEYHRGTLERKRP